MIEVFETEKSKRDKEKMEGFLFSDKPFVKRQRDYIKVLSDFFLSFTTSQQESEKIREVKRGDLKISITDCRTMHKMLHILTFVNFSSHFLLCP